MPVDPFSHYRSVEPAEKAPPPAHRNAPADTGTACPLLPHPQAPCAHGAGSDNIRTENQAVCSLSPADISSPASECRPPVFQISVRDSPPPSSKRNNRKVYCAPAAAVPLRTSAARERPHRSRAHPQALRPGCPSVRRSAPPASARDGRSC